MTERSAEQAPVQTRPETQDNTARIPLAERLQRRLSAGEEPRTNGTSAPVGAPAGAPAGPAVGAANGVTGQAPSGSSRVLPPPPPELAAQQAREAEARRAAEARAANDTLAVAPVAPAVREQSGGVMSPAPAAPTSRRTGA